MKSSVALALVVAFVTVAEAQYGVGMPGGWIPVAKDSPDVKRSVVFFKNLYQKEYGLENIAIKVNSAQEQIINGRNVLIDVNLYTSSSGITLWSPYRGYLSVVTFRVKKVISECKVLLFISPWNRISLLSPPDCRSRSPLY